MVTKPTWFWPTLVGVTTLTGLGATLVIRALLNENPALKSCSWVAVWAASNSFGASTEGWAPAKSNEKAYDIIADKTKGVE